MNRILAQALTLPGGAKITGPTNFNYSTVTGVISEAITFIFAIAGVGLLIMIILAGFTLLTSIGDPKKMEMGKSKLTSAIIGFVIIFTAYWITQIVGTMLGFSSILNVFK